MHKLKHFWPVIVLILQVPIVIASFKILSNPKWAGLIGAGLFFSVGVWLANHYFQALGSRSAALYALLGHVFVFVIPILCFRLAFWSIPFEEIHVGNFYASSLHSLSEKYFGLVLWAAIYDGFRLLRREAEAN